MKTFAWPCAAVWVLALACGGEHHAEAPGPASSASDAPAEEEGAPPSDEAVAPCTTDASCNADPAVSALWGFCDVETGKCTCREAGELDPVSERCRPAPR